MKGLPSILIRRWVGCTEWGSVGFATQDPVVGPWSSVVGKTKLFALGGGMANRGQVFPVQCISFELRTWETGKGNSPVEKVPANDLQNARQGHLERL
jgi:hypothetical protein